MPQNLIRPYLHQLHSDNSSELKVFKNIRLENQVIQDKNVGSRFVLVNVLCRRICLWLRRGREDKGTNLHPHYKERLSEIGLNARHI